MSTNDSNTEVPNEHTSEGAKQGHYPDTGEAIRDVQRYQQDHGYLCENPWHHLQVGKASNLCLGSGKVMYQNHESTITLRIDLGTRHQLATAPCIHWRII